MLGPLFLFSCGFALAIGTEPPPGKPSMKFSRGPIHVYEGEDVLITCVVQDIGDNIVWWKKELENRTTVELTAGDARLTSDRRIDVLHDPTPENPAEKASRGDVWVLVIRDAKPNDTGIYICEVKSDQVVRSFHRVNVVTRDLHPPSSTSEENPYEEEKFSSKSHNYTDCCVAKNVSTNCIGFCSIQNIIEGNTGQGPESCEQDFPEIVRCMADGRNHVPCCIQERVPDICQDVCRGEYTAITENIKTHFSCSAYTEQTLACIVEGVELLPSPPEFIRVDPLTSTSLNVSWMPPQQNADTLDHYIINVTSLRTFDEHNDDTPSTATIINTTHYGVPANHLSLVLPNLIPFTMYEISVTSANKHGTSLPSYKVRAMTLVKGEMKPGKVGQAPQLPDIKSCCINKGITHKTCLSKLCDPAVAERVEITDLMICAPWATDTFSCLTNGLDHTPCCKARGLPELCQQLCTGNVSSIDFNYFKCLRYMGEYTNCLLQGYGVLPSAPTAVHITNIETDFAIVHWSPPKTLGDTVLHYNLHYRLLSDNEDSEYESIMEIHSPYILEDLESETDYEVYVEAVNVHGIGDPSIRITFRTESQAEEEAIEEASYYNVTACCVEAELSSVCMPLCSYNANMSDIRVLAGVCAAEFPKLLRCGAGGRDHTPCCKRRGVPTDCIRLCGGIIAENIIYSATRCMSYIGNIAQCFEEGTELLPAQVDQVYATVINETSIFLEWAPPLEGANVTGYVVEFIKVENLSMHDVIPLRTTKVNVTDTSVILTDLETNATYHIVVVAKNEHGTSLPSSIILIHLLKPEDESFTSVSGVTSPPHSLAVLTHSATWVTITWQPPAFSHPSEKITYRLYYKFNSEEKYHMINSTVTSVMIKNLNPNTQYIIYVVALSTKGESVPSETLVAWTDPAYPAFVEPPTIHPINLVIEGSSMTILCIAMGTPLPTISLYVSGRLVRQETTRHMVTVIHNVTRDMNQISCYADNGYGTPMQASKKITISHGPHIQASGITMATLGDSVTLECKVDALPSPKMLFWRNHEERTPVIQGGNYDISTSLLKDETDKYVMRLTIKHISDADVGEYYCHAENAFGSATQPVSVRIRNIAATNNVTQCCIEQNVTSACMDACSFFLDFDAVINKSSCITDFDKLMKCAADGSDHRSCCGQQGVPRRCLDWCRGEPILNSGTCVLSYTKQIMNCFHEGREKLPGPPQNVRVEYMDSHSVKVSWDPPIKNPHTVEMYRVFWRSTETTGRSSHKADTSETSLTLAGLTDGTTYECVIKAGNRRGTSTLTEPIKFTMGEKYITTAANVDERSSSVGVAVAVVLALLIVAAIVVAAVWFIRTKRLLGMKNSNGVAFENPSYLREVNMDHIQGPPNSQTEALTNGTANGIAVSSSSGGQGWKNEALHVPVSTEVNPTLYEELKLGQDGAGFKRLKP